MLHLRQALGILALFLTTAVYSVSIGRHETTIGTLPESVTNWQKSSHAHPDKPYSITITFEGKDMASLDHRMEEIAMNGTQRWLTAEELRQYTSPEQNHEQAVVSFFKQHGIRGEAIVQHHLGVSEAGDVCSHAIDH